MKWFLLFSVLFFSLPLYASGWGCWELKTPYSENVIDYCDGQYDYLSYDCRTSHDIENMQSWYFYDSCTIGTFVRNDSTFYFVMNEASCTYTNFDNRKEWQVFLSQNDLEPRFWERTYTGSWQFFGPELNEFIFLSPIMSIIISLVLLLIVSLLFSAVFRSTQRKNRIIAGLVLMLIALFVLLDIFPQSF